MRTRIRVAGYEVEFDGSAALWNEVLRPIFGDAPPEESASEPPPRPASRDARPPRPTPRPTPHQTPRPARGSPPDVAVPVQALQDAFDDLAESGGRRAEKDAVLLTVLELGGESRDVVFDAVARTLHARAAFCDVRVKPHLLKHINRTRMLDAGAVRETARLTDKGLRYVRSLLQD